MENETRTEAQILCADAKTVTLGGRQYTLVPKRGRKHSRAIRRKLGNILGEVSGLGETIKALIDSGVEKVNSDAVAALAPLLQRFLGPSFDDLLDIVYDYSDEIAADREWLEENATDEEFVRAIMVLIGFLFGPFAKAMGIAYEKKMATSRSGGDGSSSSGQKP